MSDYTDSIDVHAPADAVFRFVSDVKNLPRYLPTVHQAKAQGGERVALDGEANGHPYHSDGWFKAEPDARRLRWGSDGENDYSGQLEVAAAGNASKVTCTLRFSPKPEVAQQMQRLQGGRDAAIRDGLKASLVSIKQLCEGTGGKQMSSAERPDQPV
ncbi:MAG: SRPBCC family protein [Acidisphaera sp.]|nr:SRPBCC family protein [Acidisphaera sp.]